MNILDNKLHEKKKFEIRNYQYQGWRDMLFVIKQYLEWTLLLNGKTKDIDESLVWDFAESLFGTMNYKENIDLKTSIPLWMATGSGKSYTMGEMMNKIFKLKKTLKYFLHIMNENMKMQAMLQSMQKTV